MTLMFIRGLLSCSVEYGSSKQGQSLNDQRDALAVLLKNRRLSSRLYKSDKAQDQSAIDRREMEIMVDLPILATTSRLILWIVV